MANQVSYVVEPSGPNLLIRLLWFVFVGWWLGGMVSGFAWFLNATIIGLPLGLWLINRLPTLITLRPQELGWRVENGVVRQGQEQQPFLLRAIYFVLIGWWFSGLWMGLAYILLVSIIGLPVAFWIYGRVGAVTTLYRS
ncbi:MAG: YccF domain-containing protein [Chloroflexi bacterium]|nr:YccF domain-containing protein [Chloroflexota bacterium]